MHVLRVSQTVRVWKSHREQRSKRVHKSCTNLLWVLAQEAFASPPSCCCCNQMPLLNGRKKTKNAMPSRYPFAHHAFMAVGLFPFHSSSPELPSVAVHYDAAEEEEEALQLRYKLCIFSQHLRSVNAPSIREHATRVLDCNQKPENFLLERCIGKTCT
jgi:hypothetical protein